jgi:hypothetical protein
MNSLAIRILTLATLLGMVAVCANAAPQSPTAKDAALRRAIIHVLGKEYSGELRFASRRADLNGDGRSEILVWVPTNGYGGTSGYPLVIF